MNEVVKRAGMVGTLANKPKRGERRGQWAKEALSEGLIKEIG